MKPKHKILTDQDASIRVVPEICSVNFSYIVLIKYDSRGGWDLLINLLLTNPPDFKQNISKHLPVAAASV